MFLSPQGLFPDFVLKELKGIFIEITLETKKWLLCKE